MNAPCGCAFADIDGMFVMEPCSPTCGTYAYAIEEARKQGKPIETIDLSRSGKLDENVVCPKCGAANDAFSGPPGERPEPGNLLVCAYCVHLSVVTETGVRDPSPDEQSDIDQDEHVQSMLNLMRATKRNS